MNLRPGEGSVAQIALVSNWSPSDGEPIAASADVRVIRAHDGVIATSFAHGVIATSFAQDEGNLTVVDQAIRTLGRGKKELPSTGIRSAL